MRDEVSVTLQAYEDDAADFIEKYQQASISKGFGAEFRAELPGERLLDLGCGPGVDVKTFSNEGYEVVGLDLTSSFLQAARETVNGDDFVRGDMRTLPFERGSFDGLWSCASFLHVPRSEAVETLAEFRRVLRTGGVCFLSVKRKSASTESTERHFTLYSETELRESLSEASLTVVQTTSHGDWIQAIARK